MHPLGPVGAQGLAQGINLAVQLALLAILGQDRFASLGLGLMAASSVCFLGEAGYGPYFLRESASRTDWLPPWREAAGSRLVVLSTAFFLAWIALGWGARDPASARQLLWIAIPGIIATAFNPTPVMFGLGLVRQASGGVLMRALLQGGGGVAAALALPDFAAAGLGAAFSAGIISQVLLGQWVGLPKHMLLPVFCRRLPPLPALRLWGLALVGTLHDRALPFIIGAIRPDILAIGLIVIQVLQALVGLAGQMDRLLIPAAARGDDPVQAWREIKPPLTVFAAAVIITLPGLAWLFYPGERWTALLLALEWAAVLTGALSFSLIFARKTEQTVARIMMCVVPLSTLVQILLASKTGLEMILVLRVAVAMAVAWLTVRSLNALGRSGHA